MANNYDIQSYENDPFGGLIQLWVALGTDFDYSHSNSWVWCFDSQAYMRLYHFNGKTKNFVEAVGGNDQAFKKLKNFLNVGLENYGKGKNKSKSYYSIEWSSLDHEHGTTDCIIMSTKNNAPTFVPHLYLKVTTSMDGKWIIVFHD